MGGTTSSEPINGECFLETFMKLCWSWAVAAILGITGSSVVFWNIKFLKLLHVFQVFRGGFQNVDIWKKGIHGCRKKEWGAANLKLKTSTFHFTGWRILLIGNSFYCTEILKKDSWLNNELTSIEYVSISHIWQKIFLSEVWF